jgi:O-antigen/teichoic acid export membrane protein
MPQGNNKNKGKGQGKGGKGKGKKKGKQQDSSAAALGATMARYGGLQGISLVLTNVISLLTFVYVATKLGKTSLGEYSLLIFLSSSISQVFHLFSKPGTLRRTFGQADDDDAGSEGDFAEKGQDDEQSESPERSLGVGIAWVALLGLIGAVATIVFRDWIAEVLLGDESQADLIFWAGILGGAGAIFKLTEIVIWFEGRGWTYVAVDASRPAFSLVFMAYLVGQGEGVKGAIIGGAIGTTVATIISVTLLIRSFEPAFDFKEVWLIVQRGFGRMPIALSMFTVQNADVFILSRFVGHADLGQYQLAQKFGFIVSFLPQGFRIALRPLRKTAMFQAVRDQYGSAVAKGQLLSYFLIISIFAILAMILSGGAILLATAGSQYDKAAPLIPLTAAMMTMPALFRTVNGQSFFPHKRAFFISCVIFAALSYIGWMLLLVPKFGIVAAPVCSLLGFGIPTLALFIRNQMGKGKLAFPYLAIAKAVLMAAAIAVLFDLTEPSSFLKFFYVVALLALWVVLIFVTGVIPKMHRRGLLIMARGIVVRAPHGFNRRKGLKALNDRQREDLRAAVVDRIPVQALTGAETAEERRADEKIASNGSGKNGGGPPSKIAVVKAILSRRSRKPKSHANYDNFTRKDAQRLVRLLRKVGREGGSQIGKPTKYDARIAKFLFADVPVASKGKAMRGLIGAGATAGDLHKLEELNKYLAKIPARAWEGNDNGRRRIRRIPVRAPARLRRS